MTYRILAEFHPIEFVQKKLRDEHTSGYKVYSSKNSYVIIKADVVSDAIEKSGINEPYKVKKVHQSIGSILKPLALASVENIPKNPPTTDAEPTEEPKNSPENKAPEPPTEESKAPTESSPEPA